MKEEHSIIIVDDHKLFREGLELVIANLPGFSLAGQAPDSESFLEMLDHIKVSIVLMDISLPGMNGITATELAIKKQPDLKVIALTMFCDREHYTKMVDAGVSGYILKDSGKEELIRALRAVSSGEKYFSQKLLYSMIINSESEKRKQNLSVQHDLSLNQKEAELLKLICRGFSNAEITKTMAMSNRALEEYKANLISKTGVKDVLNLAIFAVKNNLVEL